MRHGLEVTPAGGRTRLWPYAELHQTQGSYTGEEVRLERGGPLPEVLLVEDLGFLQSLHEVAPDRPGRFHNPAQRGRRRRLTILAAGGIVILTALIYLWGIPLLAATVAAQVPASWEDQLGRSTVKYLAPPERRCEDPKLVAAIDTMVGRLMATRPASPYTFRVYVVDLPVFNAFAAPGGSIVVFRGLLERTDTPEELAGVLAHELQHILHRHTTRAIIQHTSSGLLMAALTGDVTGPLVYGLETARVLGQLHYSRGAEEEADSEGLKMLLAARVDPGGMIAFFNVLEKRSGTGPDALKYLSTHPSSGDRVATLTAFAAQHPIQPIKLLPEEDWGELRNTCGAAGPAQQESTR
jgi:predicted Zn-dependent protease